MTTVADAIVLVRAIRTELIANHLDSLGHFDLAHAIRLKFGSGEELKVEHEQAEPGRSNG